MAQSKQARLDKTIDEAAVAAKESIDAYKKLAKKGASQLAGDSPSGTDKWVELTAKTWAQMARDAAQAWITWNAALQALAESAESKAGGPKAGGPKSGRPKSGGPKSGKADDDT